MQKYYWLAILVCCARANAFQPAAREWSKPVLARMGLHHSNVSGRFVDPAGNPLNGVRVAVTGRNRSGPLAETLTAADGKFRFNDVNSDILPTLAWYPPEGWMNGAIALRGQSAEDFDIGDIQLKPESVLRLVTEVVDGGVPFEGNRREPTVVLSAGSLAPRVLAVRNGPHHLLRQIPFREGTLEVSLYNKDHSEEFRAPIQLDPNQRDRLLLLRVRRDTLKKRNQYASEGKLEVSEILLPPSPSESDYEISTRITSPDGKPVQGVVVSISDLPIFNRASPVTGLSGSDGVATLRYRSTTCLSPSFALGSVATWYQPTKSDTEIPCTKKIAAEVTIGSPSQLAIHVTGLPASATPRASWWHPSHGWVAFSSLNPWVGFPGYSPVFKIKVDAAGYLPIITTVESKDYLLRGDKPPAKLDASFTFNTSNSMNLDVTSEGKPIENATVDIEVIDDLASDSRQPVGVYHTDRSGKLTLYGTSPDTMEIFVYAAGYEPARAVWSPGSPLRINLIPRSASLSFSQLRPGHFARIRSVTKPDDVRTFQKSVDGPAAIKLVPGSYDVVLFTGSGQPIGSQRIALVRNQSADLDPKIDARPKLTVRSAIPEDTWRTSISIATPATMITGWTLYSGQNGAVVTDSPAVLEKKSLREEIFRLSHPGKFHVVLSQPNLGHTLWREIEVSPGSETILDVPVLSASLKGLMRTYKGGIGFEHHGWAGPRLQLISASPSGWSVTVPMPSRDPANVDAFTLTNLPAGTYHLHQHLIGNPPVDAWGGIPVTLTSSQTVTLNDFSEYPYKEATLTFRDASGNPINQATFRLKDRMSESWRQIAEGPTTLSNAAHPIPYPPALRIIAGRVTLPAIRVGRLEGAIEFDDGRVIPLVADIDPANQATLSISTGAIQ